MCRCGAVDSASPSLSRYRDLMMFLGASRPFKGTGICIELCYLLMTFTKNLLHAKPLALGTRNEMGSKASLRHDMFITAY